LAKKKEIQQSDVPSRRNFFKTAWMILGGAALFEGAWVVGDLLGRGRPDIGPAKADSLLVAGPLERFEVGSVTPFPQGKFYLVRLLDGGFLALSRECTHLGCTVPWDKKSERFVCPCHASSFSIKGEVMNPPAPRPLNTYAVRIENKIVKVDIGSVQKRSAFSIEQVAYP
jgi:cytochrome b6-f complex iron-sulfur subunit